MKKFLSIVDINLEICQVGIVEAATREQAVLKTLQETGLSKDAIRFIHVYAIEDITPFWYFRDA